MDDQAMLALYGDRPEPTPAAVPIAAPPAFTSDYQRRFWEFKFRAGRAAGYPDDVIERDCRAIWAKKCEDPAFRRRNGIPDPV